MDRITGERENGRTGERENHYILMNTSSNYQMDSWQFSLRVEKLLNEDYYSARSQAFTYSGYNTKGLGTTIKLGMKTHF